MGWGGVGGGPQGHPRPSVVLLPQPWPERDVGCNPWHPEWEAIQGDFDIENIRVFKIYIPMKEDLGYLNGFIYVMGIGKSSGCFFLTWSDKIA